jgi:hypothetical protein
MCLAKISKYVKSEELVTESRQRTLLLALSLPLGTAKQS